MEARASRVCPRLRCGAGERAAQPVAAVEPTVAIIVAPGLKIKAGGELNFAAYPAFFVGATYLIGAK